jgi:hypothetical protein
MDAIYHVKADELDENFLEALKVMFKDKEIEIAVSERTKPHICCALRRIVSDCSALSPMLKAHRTSSRLNRDNFIEA